MKVAILRYNAGNTASVENALRRLDVETEVSDDPAVLRSADKVIFPGVGEASSAMAYLIERGLDGVIRSLRQPVLGICLGMQLMCSASEENDARCLGIAPYMVRRFPATAGLKVPHIGWNNVRHSGRGLFKGIADGEYFYFVHGFFVEDAAEAAARCTYVCDFTAAFAKENFYAVQFHPERSGPAGEKLLENFLEL